MSRSAPNPMRWTQDAFRQTKLAVHHLTIKFSCRTEEDDTSTIGSIGPMEPPKPVCRRLARRTTAFDLHDIYHDHSIIIAEQWIAELDAEISAEPAPSMSASSSPSPFLSGSTMVANTDGDLDYNKKALVPGTPMEREERRVAGAYRLWPDVAP